MNSTSNENKERTPFNPFRSQLPLESETTRFILVSVLDIVMTYLVIRYSHEGKTGLMVHEGNPIPAFFIRRWGFSGMIAFKMAIVAFVTLVAQLVARSHLEKARWILNVGTILVALVVLYSLYLMVSVWRW